MISQVMMVCHKCIHFPGTLADGLQHSYGDGLSLSSGPRILGLQRYLAWKITRPVPTRKDALQHDCLFILRAGPSPLTYSISFSSFLGVSPLQAAGAEQDDSEITCIASKDDFFTRLSFSFLPFYLVRSLSDRLSSCACVRETCHSLIIKQQAMHPPLEKGKTDSVLNRYAGATNAIIARTSRAMRTQSLE
jgi:hypothetical protein